MQGLAASDSEADPGSDLAPALALLGQIEPGARILDLGCGLGGGVTFLIARGFDAFGADIFEYWGNQAHLCWHKARQPADVLARLTLAESASYRLPYPGNHFDHVISMQVVEHLDDRAAVFAEVARVLKPDGTSVHLYPDARRPFMEGHINVPFSALCKNRAYLALAAVLGFRSARQQGLGWREVYRANRAQMEMTHYPPGRQVLREVRAAGMAARFAGRDYVMRSDTGWSKLHRELSRFRLGWTVLLAGRMMLQPMLVTQKTRTAQAGRPSMMAAGAVSTPSPRSGSISS
ncbi:MAG: class I SAM-dependent methyltransferase [Croceibacterium sp.]